ncbi:MAG: amidohydrolase family protein [Bacillota bacterium]
MVRPEDIQRFAGLGVIASIQPGHVPFDRRAAECELGARANRVYPFKQLKDAGTTLVSGADAPIAPPDPIHGIFCAVHRHLPDEKPDRAWYPAECLTVEDSLRAVTCDAAYAVGKESVIGDLAPGKYADFVVLSEDICAVPLRDLMNVKVKATAIGGRFVHGSF